MKTMLFLLLGSVMFQPWSEADTPQPVDDQHLILYGNIVEMLYGSENEANAPFTRVIIYRDNEIYCAFKSNDKGEYVFNLPLGYEYELDFGGDDFVNKKVVIDATNINGKRAKREVAMDVSLFRPVESVDYTDMQKPIVRWYFDKGHKEMIPDLEIVDSMWRTVEKLYKKSEKAALRAAR